MTGVWPAAEHWTPGFSQAVEEIEQQASRVSYVTKENIHLQDTADLEPWEPSLRIQDVVPNWRDIRVVPVHKNITRLNVINSDLRESKDVGLILMGPLSRKKKPSLILLTTETKIYAIDGKDDDYGIKFLKCKLQDEYLRYWTTNGIKEADSLYHNYDIDLSERKNINCCSGLHVNLMQTMRKRPKPIQMLFPALAIYQARAKPKIESFEKLVERWLDIYPSDFHYEQSQLAHLNLKTFDQTAENIIKKRCLLVRPLALKLYESSRREVKFMSKNAFRGLDLLPDQMIATQKLSEKYQQRGEALITFYMHLDFGMPSLEWKE